MRCDNYGFNIEAGFFAALSALDKRVEFRYIPHYHFNVNDKQVHFVGEINQRFSEIIIDGDIRSDKFVIYYIFGEEIVGFLTFGYKNLHLYLWEAMKLLVMPQATPLRQKIISYKEIVATVL